MNLIFKEENTRPGNDCLIEEGFYILEVFEYYLALHVTHYSGWMGDEYNKESEICKTESSARKQLKKWGLDDL